MKMVALRCGGSRLLLLRSFFNTRPKKYSRYLWCYLVAILDGTFISYFIETYLMEKTVCKIDIF